MINAAFPARPYMCMRSGHSFGALCHIITEESMEYKICEGRTKPRRDCRAQAEWLMGRVCVVDAKTRMPSCHLSVLWCWCKGADVILACISSLPSSPRSPLGRSTSTGASSTEHRRSAAKLSSQVSTDARPSLPVPPPPPASP